MRVRREGPVIYLSAIRDDGSLGASMAFSAEHTPQLVDALMSVYGAER